MLSTTSKVFLKILQGRISRAVDELIDDEQAGFRHGRNTTDNIFTVRNILESCEEWRCRLFINFIDFRKAFDSISRDALWRVFIHYMAYRRN